MSQKGFYNIIIWAIVVVVLAVASGYFLLTQRQEKQQTAPNQETKTVIIKNTGGEADKIIYENKTLGFAFRYPPDWRIEGGTYDPITKGDIIKDGKVYTSFSIAVLPPEWGASTEERPRSAIQVTHTLYDYGDKLLEARWNALKCFDTRGATLVACEELKNKNGLNYIKAHYHLELYGTREIIAWVLTNKDIIAFRIEVSEKLEDIDNASIKALGDLVDTIELR